MNLKNLFSGVLSLFLLTLIVPNSHALFDNLVRAARPAGLGGAFTAVADDENALYWNPAGLTQIENTGISAMYESLFGVSELNHTLFNGVFPRKNGTLGVSYVQFGAEMYKEQTIGISYGFNFGGIFSAGATLNNYSLTISGDDYGSASVTGLDLGLLARVNKDIRAGLFMRNLNNPALGKENRINLPQSVSAGFAYDVFPGFLFAVDLGRDAGFDSDLRAGFEYKTGKTLTLRAGGMSVPNRFSAGFGIRLGKVALDYSLLTHPYLDVSHQIAFSFRFIRIQKEEETGIQQKQPEVDEFGY